jgi:hypothetical protein
MQTSGIVLDLYDDDSGEMLKSIYPSVADVPDLVKEAHRLDGDDFTKLPDDVFALVAVVDGDTKIRKYACVDPGNTVLSIEYFLKTAHRLPDEAQKQTAENLVTACGWYGLEPPSQLKEAMIGMGLRAAMAAPMAAGAYDQSKQNLATAGQVAPGQIMTPHQIQRMQAMQQPTPPMPMRKMAEATMTYHMPTTPPEKSKQKSKAPIKTAECSTDHKREALKKKLVKEARVSGHSSSETSVAPDTETMASSGLVRELHKKTFRTGMDLRGKEPTVVQAEKKAEHIALGKYPMDNLAQLQKAAAYFEDHKNAMPPDDKREFCCVMVKRADMIGASGLVSYDARKYASSGYAPTSEMKMSIDARKNAIGTKDPVAVDVLDGLFEKSAAISPDLYCETLRQFDEMTGLYQMYNRFVPDPIWSTYGFHKTAEDDEGDVMTLGGEGVSKRQLKEFVSPSDGKGDGFPLLKKMFGEDMAKEFQKDPIGIFSSLPREQKTLVMRLVNDTHPAGFTTG